MQIWQHYPLAAPALFSSGMSLTVSRAYVLPFNISVRSLTIQNRPPPRFLHLLSLSYCSTQVIVFIVRHHFTPSGAFCSILILALLRTAVRDRRRNSTTGENPFSAPNELNARRYACRDATESTHQKHAAKHVPLRPLTKRVIYVLSVRLRRLLFSPAIGQRTKTFPTDDTAAPSAGLAHPAFY